MYYADMPLDLSVDLRDAVGERLHLSTQFHRHGVRRDVYSRVIYQQWRIHRLFSMLGKRK